MELVILLWVIFSAIVGQHAHHYGRSGLAWFLASLLFSPILVGIVALIAGRPYAWTTAAGGTAAPPDDHRPCPFCAEPIKPQAIKCRWCGADLEQRGARNVP